jgi:hypothetical protein
VFVMDRLVFIISLASFYSGLEFRYSEIDVILAS